MKESYTKEEYNYIFEKDENGAFVRLIIPANVPVEISECKDELNLIGKLPKDFTLDEIVRMKKYAGAINSKIKDKN